MSKKTITVAKFIKLLPSLCDRITSQSPEGWTPENPLYGHCAVVSLVAKNLFGGELLRGSLAEIPEFAHMRSHYWNRLGDGAEADFTKPQFGEHYPLLEGEPRTREYVLSSEPTRVRYNILAFRLAHALHEDDAIFGDIIFQTCFSAALESPCQKMKFGCVITHKGNIVYEGCNAPIEPLKPLCEPLCIRLSIQSRTESMLGACGHAEELGLWNVVRKGIPVSECSLYVAGLHMNGLPWFKSEANSTCLRCAVQMYHADLRHIYVPTASGWAELSPKRAVETARAYALKEKIAV